LNELNLEKVAHRPFRRPGVNDSLRPPHRRRKGAGKNVWNARWSLEESEWLLSRRV